MNPAVSHEWVTASSALHRELRRLKEKGAAASRGAWNDRWSATAAVREESTGPPEV
jgi:hypothetical protein